MTAEHKKTHNCIRMIVLVGAPMVFFCGCMCVGRFSVSPADVIRSIAQLVTGSDFGVDETVSRGTPLRTLADSMKG